jgi:hypothetical protein
MQRAEAAEGPVVPLAASSDSEMSATELGSDVEDPIASLLSVNTEEPAWLPAPESDDDDGAAGPGTIAQGDFHWQDAVELLRSRKVAPRPSRIPDQDTTRQQVFLE